MPIVQIYTARSPTWWRIVGQMLSDWTHQNIYLFFFFPVIISYIIHINQLINNALCVDYPTSTVFIKLAYMCLHCNFPLSSGNSHITTYKRVIKIQERERSAMSSRRTSSSASKITEDEINNLIMKLRPLLPRLNQRRNGTVYIYIYIYFATFFIYLFPMLAVCLFLRIITA